GSVFALETDLANQRWPLVLIGSTFGLFAGIGRCVVGRRSVRVDKLQGDEAHEGDGAAHRTRPAARQRAMGAVRPGARAGDAGTHASLTWVRHERWATG